MSLQRSVRLGLTHFPFTRLVAHFIYTLINIRYAWGLAVSDSIGGHVTPTLFRCKGMAVLAESWQGQAAKPIPRQFSWQASTSCYTWWTGSTTWVFHGNSRGIPCLTLCLPSYHAQKKSYTRHVILDDTNKRSHTYLHQFHSRSPRLFTMFAAKKKDDIDTQGCGYFSFIH